MAEEQTAQAISEPQVSQVTSPTPATRPAKNPKRVAAGKMVAERTRVACEAQKKAYNDKKSAPEPVTETAPGPAPVPVADSGLSTTTWISIIGIGATLFTTYVKREDIKAFWATAPAPRIQEISEPEPVQPSRIPQPKKGLRPMD